MNLFQKLILPLLLALVANASSTCSAQDNQSLRWALKPNEKLAVILEQTTNIKTDIASRSQQANNTMLLEMDWNVVSATDEQFEIEQTITRIRLTINTPNKSGVKTTTIDTESEGKTTELGASLLEQIKPLIGTKFNVSMTPRGEIAEVSIPKDSLAQIRLAPASMPIRELLTEKGLKDLIGQSAIVFPENSISAGEDWTIDAGQKNTAFSKTNTVTFIGTSLSDGVDVHTFKVNTDITESSNGVEQEVEPGTTKMTIQEFSGGGKIVFSPDGLVVVDSDMKNKMMTNRNYREKTIRTTVTTDIKMKVKRKQ